MMAVPIKTKYRKNTAAGCKIVLLFRDGNKPAKRVAIFYMGREDINAILSHRRC